MRTATVVGVLAFLAACSDPPPPEARMVTGDLRAHPWPSDALVDAAGRLAVAPPFPFQGKDPAGIQLLAAALSELDGFGTTTSVFFP
jgi:hypothetical protein